MFLFLFFLKRPLGILPVVSFHWGLPFLSYSIIILIKFSSILFQFLTQTILFSLYLICIMVQLRSVSDRLSNSNKSICSRWGCDLPVTSSCPWVHCFSRWCLYWPQKDPKVHEDTLPSLRRTIWSRRDTKQFYLATFLRQHYYSLLISSWFT